MSRFNPILMDKIAAESAEQGKQEKLKRKIGYGDTSVIFKEKSSNDYVFSILSGFSHTCFIVLIYLGILSWLNPDSQKIMLDMIRWIFA